MDGFTTKIYFITKIVCHKLKKKLLQNTE